MRKILIIGISLVIFFSIIIFVIIPYLAAYRALHLDSQAILRNPGDYDLDFESIEFVNSENHKLRGWWIPGKKEKVIIVIHGYGANKAGWSGQNKNGQQEYLDWLAVAPFLVRAGYNLMYFDLRACGESDGKLTTLGKYEANDLLAAIRWQLKNKKIKNIGLLGFSMGANVSLRAGIKIREMMEQKTIKSMAIIAIGPFKYSTMLDKSIKYWTSLPSFYTPLINFYGKIIVGFDLSAEINPELYIKKLNPIPILFIQSEKDEIGDVRDVRNIFDSYQGPKRLIVIPNASRFVHYKFPGKNPQVIIDFFNSRLEN